MDYRIIYIGAQVVYGALFLVLLYLRHANDPGRKFDKLDVLHVFFIITVVLDAIWMGIDGRAEYRTWHIALELVYLSIMATVGYLWFLYTLDFFPTKSMKIRKYRYVLAIPVLVEIAAIVASVWTGWIFVVTEEGRYIRGDFATYPILLNYAFMVIGSLIALRSRKEALLTMDKRRYTAAALFPVPVLLLSGAQMLMPPGLPGMQGGVLVSFLLLFGVSQNTMITRDHLTGLPNRFAFEQDLLDRIHRHQPGEKRRLYLLEGDLDKFKHINDTYGHPVGDVALKRAAEVLRRVFSRYGAGVFRTGGDEFMMVTEAEGALDVGELQSALNSELAKVELPDGFTLSMSLGAEEYDGKANFRTFIERVDQKLYEAKRMECV